jgi:hypothetical protein
MLVQAGVLLDATREMRFWTDLQRFLGAGAPLAAVECAARPRDGAQVTTP